MTTRFALSSVILSALLSAPLLAQDVRPPNAPWQGQVQAAIQEHEASWRASNDVELTTVHRGEGLRACLSDQRLTVSPRDPSAGAWALTLHTAAWGRDGTRTALAAAELNFDGRLANLQRSGLREWFLNGAAGVEQGWELTAPPPGDGTGLLQLELSFVGLSPSLAEDGRSALLVDALGTPLLNYHGLIAWDATGRPLDARLVLDGSATLVEVDDTGAVYPITIDPVLSGVAWNFDGDQTDAWLGWSVTSAGDVNGDGYDDVIVGAPQYDTLVTDGGAAFVFHGSAGGLSPTPAWVEEFDGEANAQFGMAVASAGDVNGDGYDDVIVSAPFRDNGLTDAGAVWLWYGSAAGLGGSPDWSALSLDDGAEFGSGLAGLGDVNGDGYDDVAVGAPKEDEVYAWFGGPLGLGPSGLPANADWTNSGSGFYGADLNGAGDVNDDGYDDVIVGARLSGEARVYHGSPSGPSVGADWIQISPQLASGFGVSVDGAGDVNGDGYDDVVVGAWKYDDQTFNEGEVSVFHGSATGLTVGVADWSYGSGQSNAQLGRSVAGAGDMNGDGFADVMAGAFLWGDDQVQEGRVFVHLGSPGGLAPTLAWRAESNQPNSEFGEALATGDVNNDGYDDLVVGASFFDAGQTDEGAVFVFMGSATGLDLLNPWMAQGAQAGAAFGRAVTTLDVDANGYDDVLIGAYLHETSGEQRGSVFLFKGSATGLGPNGSPGNADWTVSGQNDQDWFGLAVAGADIDGDGDDEAIVGAAQWDEVVTDGGAGLVYISNGMEPAATPSWTLVSGESGSELGFTLARAGDVNGDGYDDVAFGMPSAAFAGTTKAGRVAVFHGSPSGLGSVAGWYGNGGQTYARFGRALASAGDVNGDGYDELLVGAPRLDVLFGAVPTDQGRALLFYGGPGGLTPPEGTPSNCTWQVMINGPQADSGWSVGSGDVNGDGYSDVLVGAPAASVVMAFTGSPNGPATSAEWAVSVPGAELGTSVVAGDMDGDGLDDVAVGAPDDSAGQLSEGTVSVFRGEQAGPWFNLGNAKPGLRGEPRLLGNGDLIGGELAQVVLFNVAENEQVYLILGLSTIYAPAKGGVVVPSLDLIFPPFPTGVGPAITLPTVWPVGLPSGAPIYLQAWITDPFSSTGFAASNGLGATLP